MNCVFQPKWQNACTSPCLSPFDGRRLRTRLCPSRGNEHQPFFHSLQLSDDWRSSQGMKQDREWPQRSPTGRVLVASSHHFIFTFLFFISVYTLDLFSTAVILSQSRQLRKASIGRAARPIEQMGKTEKIRQDETWTGHKVTLSAPRQLGTTLVYLTDSWRPQRWRFYTSPSNFLFFKSFPSRLKPNFSGCNLSPWLLVISWVFTGMCLLPSSWQK